MFREENEAVSALLCSDTVSDTVSDTLCVALSFSPYNIAFDCPFLCFIKITFVCFADWGSASDTLTDTLRFPPWNIAFGCQFLSFIKITFVCLADWGSASDTLSDTLSFSPLNIAFGCPFLSFINEDHIRLFSGLGISKWYAQWCAQLSPLKYCIWLSISFFP